MKNVTVFLALCFLLSCHLGRTEKTCNDLRLDFDRSLSATIASCQTDEDCVCFQGGLSLSLVCGGVTNQTAFDKLATNIKRQEELKCGFTALCEPWLCVPLCVEGKCSAKEF